MVAKKLFILFAGLAAAFFMLTGCSDKGPGEVTGIAKTGSVSPVLLYKTAAGTSFTIPAADTNNVYTIAITVKAVNSPFLLSQSFDYSAHWASLPGIPIGEVIVSVAALDWWDDTLYSGQVHATVAEGRNTSPVVNMVPYVPPSSLHTYIANIYGQMAGRITLQLFPWTATAPSYSSLPTATAVRSWTYVQDTIRPWTQAKLDSVPDGDYWCYAYNNTDNANDWTTALKRVIVKAAQADMDTTYSNIQLNFSGARFTTSSLVKATLYGATGLTDYVADVYYYNKSYYSANSQDIFLGFYFGGNGTPGALRVDRLPSLAEMAAMYSLPSDSADYYYCYLWNDQDMYGTFNTNDLFYYNRELSTWEKPFPEVASGDSVDMGSITLDSTWQY